MSNPRSAGAFCSLIVATTTGTSDSVTSLNVAALGNGAECFCLANQAVYRYNSASAQTTVGDVFITPTSGGGCWFKQGADSSYANSFELASAAFGSSVLPAITVWHAMPSPGAGAYQAGTVGSFWTINSTTGVMTYSGPSGLQFMIMMTCSASDDALVAQQLQFDITVGGSLIGTSTATTSSVQNTMPATTVSAAEFVHNVILSPNNAATIQHAFRCISATPGNIAFLRYQVQIIKL